MQPNANMVSAIKAWTDAGMPASKILMGVPAYGYISSSSATSLVHKRDSIPETGLSNRHLAKLKRHETQMSEGHKWYVTGKARAEARRKMKRDLEKLSKRKKINVRSTLEDEDDKLAKRDGEVIVCPNNHSGLPCEGIKGQNITEINWNPLGQINVTTPGGTGVFAGNGGVKVGNGDLSGLDGNQINFDDLINYGVIVKKGVNFVGANGYTRKWDDCSSTVRSFSLPSCSGRKLTLISSLPLAALPRQPESQGSRHVRRSSVSWSQGRHGLAERNRRSRNGTSRFFDYSFSLGTRS